jgi:hypothetical protein
VRSAPAEDVGLRWSALHVAGDVGDESAAELLLRSAVESLPEPKENAGCETMRDSELLIRTMAVEALRRVAERHAAASEQLLRLIAEQPARPVLIEAVKAAKALKLSDKVAELLSENDRWILDIKILAIDEFVADPERTADIRPSSTPPRSDSARTSPTVDCWPTREG